MQKNLFIISLREYILEIYLNLSHNLGHKGSHPF